MDCYDPKWEYNAPNFVDFDKWFDRPIDHENEVPFKMEKCGICEGNTPKVNTPRSARKSRGSQAVNSCGKETKAKLLEPCKSKDTNVMVELSEVNVVKKEKHNGHLKPLRVTRSLSARNAEATAEENVQPPVAHLKRSASMRLPRSATPQNRSRIPMATKSSKQPVAAGKAKPSTPQAGRGKDLEAQPTAGKQPLRRANSLISRSTRQSRLMCKPSEVVTSAGKKKVDAQQRSVRGRSLDVVGSSGSTSSHQFKATKLNPKMFQSSVMGIKKVPRKEVTEPVGFDLETERRMQAWESKKVEEAGAYEFHANPVPVAILHGTVGIGPPPKVKLTVPESPAFATRSRSHLHQSKMEEKVPKQNTSRIMRAHPIPHTSIPFLPNYDHKTTVPEPFSFAARDMEKEKLKEEKIKMG